MCLIIYTLSDLGDSSNLIGSLSQNMTSYSPRWTVNMKQKKNRCRELDVSRTEYLRMADADGKMRLKPRESQNTISFFLE